MARIQLLLLLTLAAAWTGCDQNPDPGSPGVPGTPGTGNPSGTLPPLPEPPAIQRHVALTTPSGDGACADAEQMIEDRAVLSMRVTLENTKRYGWWGASRPGGPKGGGMDAGSSPDAGIDGGSAPGGDLDGGSAPGGGLDAGSAPGPGGNGGGGSYSSTNLQTAGVDEADVMKNEGGRIFTLSGGSLHLLQGWPDSQLQIKGTLPVGPWPKELLLTSPDRLLVFSGENPTRVTFVDVSSLSNPRVVGEVVLPGTYLTARRVGTAVRVVLQGAFPFPAGVLWWPQRSAGTAEEWAALIDALEVQNEAIIRAAPLEQWLPPAQTTDAAGQVHQVPHRCDQVSGVNASERFGMSTVVTLDAQDPTRVDRWSLLGATDLVYASPSSLYLLSRHWWWWPKSGEDATYVHRFDISGPATAIHQGSAALDGMVPGPFAVDELDGRLRAATTDSAGSRVMVLEPSGAELVEIGRTPDFAPGEILEGARFVGTRGFVVTFRRVDPLFTIDLSDPAHPAVAGELTVPGFSTYLHPVGDALLVGLGRGEWGGVQVSLFDVSDLSHPRQAAALPVGPGTSEAQYDYRAFTWLPSRGLFSIPYEAGTWVNGEYLEQTALKVYQVGAAGLAEQGTLSLGDLAGALPYWCPRARVRRSILSDHDAYAVSDDAVRVARLSNLDQPVATATLALPPPPDACQVIINGRAADPQ